MPRPMAKALVEGPGSQGITLLARWLCRPIRTTKTRAEGAPLGAGTAAQLLPIGSRGLRYKGAAKNGPMEK